jgi:MFS transporter, Spinster family, sphingosine-1-phosphate transporter
MPGVTKPTAGGPSRAHVMFTIVVFIVLASLDNAAIALIPSMVLPIREALHTSETALGTMTAVSILITALSAAAWGYAGDRSDRKRLLLVGTVVWVGGTLASAAAQTLWHLFAAQAITAIGLGSIASVGFSVISDFVSPRRRGLAMSFWGLSQGVGGLVGGLVASQLGADDFRVPLVVLSIVGLAAACLYLFAFDAPRGFRQPELTAMIDQGVPYDYRIERSQIGELVAKRTNVWLVLQGLTAQIAYGSLIWVPLLYQEKIIAEGYTVSTATKVGGLLGAIFQVGALFSILAGHIGDRVQLRTKRGRGVVSAIGITGAVPFFLAFFYVPLHGLDVTEGAATPKLLVEVLREVATNPWVTLAFGLSILALALTSADSPNWFALISDVNLPEHRGTVFGLGNLANGIGRSAGNGLTAALASAIERSLPPPMNWAVGLTVFQIFFLPTGWMYWRAAGTSPGDIDATRLELERRGRRGVVADDAGASLDDRP